MERSQNVDVLTRLIYSIPLHKARFNQEWLENHVIISARQFYIDTSPNYTIFDTNDSTKYQTSVSLASIACLRKEQESPKLISIGSAIRMRINFIS